MVQNLSTHVRGCVAADGASVKRHSAIEDVDAAALHSEKEMSEFNGAMEEVSRTVQKASSHSILSTLKIK